jgi:hypothetical protein
MRNSFRPCIRALGGLFDEKTEGRKSRDTVPFNCVVGAGLGAAKRLSRNENGYDMMFNIEF